MTLREMFQRIKTQQESRGIVTELMTEIQKLQYANECAHALHVEAGELSSSWPFAHWKTTRVDHANIKREAVDIIFFLANILSCFDITVYDIEAMFEWVEANNYKRMANGEHKTVNVCPDCGTPECGHSEAVSKVSRICVACGMALSMTDTPFKEVLTSTGIGLLHASCVNRWVDQNR